MTGEIRNIDYQSLHQNGSTWENWDKGQYGKTFQDNYEDVLLNQSDRDFLTSITRRIPILALCEPWCGDVHRQLPILAKMCSLNPCLDLKIINRDEHPEVMERFLTNGAMAIPVFIFFNDQFVEVGNWKARPAVCRQVLARAKAAGQLAEGKEAVTRIMDTTQDRLTVEELKILMDRAQSEENRWRMFYEDAIGRLTPMSSEQVLDRKRYESVIDIYHCQDFIEVCLIQDALTEAGIHFFIQMFQDRVWDGLFEQDKGVAVVQVLSEDADRAIDIIENVLMDDEEELESQA